MDEKLTFTDRLIKAIRAKRSILCVGLDPQLPAIPSSLRIEIRRRYALPMEDYIAVGHVIYEFNRQIIDAIAPHAIAVKPNIGFYEGYGQWGIWAYQETITYARCRGLLAIGDTKRGDGGDTAVAYVNAHLGSILSWGDTPETLRSVESPLRCDAVTVQPGIGSACLNSFLTAVKEFGAGVFVVTKTSFKPNSEIEQIHTASGTPVWQEVAKLVNKLGEGTEGRYGYRNFGAVIGATYPDEARIARQLLPKAWFLGPGYGGQGGSADDAVVAVNEDGLGVVVNSSRAITYAYQKGQFQGPPDAFAACAAKAAEFARDDLNAALERAGKLNF